jgi:hypothetical protein
MESLDWFPNPEFGCCVTVAVLLEKLRPGLGDPNSV